MTVAVVVIIVVAVIAVVAIAYAASRGGGISHDAGIRFTSVASSTPVLALTVPKPADVGQWGSYVVVIAASAPGTNIAPPMAPTGWTLVRSTVAAGNGFRVDTFTALGNDVSNASPFRFSLNGSGPATTGGIAPVMASASIVWIKNGGDVRGSADSPSSLAAPALPSAETSYLLRVFGGQTFAAISIPTVPAPGPQHWVLTNPKAGDEQDGHTHVVVLDTVSASPSNPPLTATRPASASGSTVAQSVLVQIFEYL
ncbi:MAG: hypothetical protein JO197_22615 [Acidobacteria bacterium]|nr:hypothetical protein [Acidobacteriota bacterium]MBV9477999.1 hypothetical protein [Acidobacteriota bacterium]